MANRLDQTFASLRSRREKALVTYVAAGDPFPSAGQTAEVVLTLSKAGADVVELGVPYSDPLADGPVIQAATQRALDHGVSPLFVFDVVRKVRESSQVPIVLMGYYANVLKMGLARFASDMSEAGADGVILSDLPPEVAGAWKAEADRRDLATIFLLAPTSTPDRIKTVCSEMRSGFVYCVSRTGVTGARAGLPADLKGLVDSIREQTDLPICVGFGVSTAEHVRTISGMSDGAVIGSKLVDFLQKNAGHSDWRELTTKLVQDWKSGTLPR